MICNNCNKHISKEAKFCRFCGAKQTENDVAVLSNPHANEVSNEQQYTYAGFWIRLMAYIFDYGLLLVVAVALYLILGEAMYDNIFVKYDRIVTTIMFVLYNIFFLSTWSTTPGKALYGLRVVKKEGNTDITTGTAISRSLLQILSTLFFGCGYWNMGADKFNQAFHDKKVGTVVLQKKKSLIIPIILTVIAAGIFLWLYSLGTEVN